MNSDRFNLGRRKQEGTPECQINLRNRKAIIWQGAKDKDGYGKFQINGDGQQQHVRAHRYAYFLRHGEWPSHLALHSCDTPSCVNPDHLEDGDQGKNVRDCVARGRHRPGGFENRRPK